MLTTQQYQLAIENQRFVWRYDYQSEMRNSRQSTARFSIYTYIHLLRIVDRCASSYFSVELLVLRNQYDDLTMK